MKLKLLPLFILATLALGCESRQSRAYSARVLFNVALADSIKLHDSGAIGDGGIKLIGEAADIIAPALDELDRAADANDAFNFERLWLDLKPKLSSLIARVVESRRKPTTGES